MLCWMPLLTTILHSKICIGNTSLEKSLYNYSEVNAECDFFPISVFTIVVLPSDRPLLTSLHIRSLLVSIP